MPIKSWSFTHNGHPIRAEIWWRFSGWNRTRLYIDHRKVIGNYDWLSFGKPLVADVGTPDGGEQKLRVRFRPSWTGLGCWFAADADPLARVHSARVYKHLQYHPEPGEEIENEFAHGMGCLLIFAFLLIMCVLYAPLMLAGGAIYAIQEKRRRRRMRKLGRFLSWPEVLKRMESAQTPCTLILQMANLTPTRAWWTQDDLLAQIPLPLPDERAIWDPSAHGAQHPLNEWCQFKYFDESTGSAFLTDLPDSTKALLRRFHDAKNRAQLREQFPKLNVVVVGFAHGTRAKAAARFAAILGDHLPSAVPRLAAGLADDDKAIRELCVQTLQLAGPAAAEAIPSLHHELYLAPHDEGLRIAKTLAALGPAGVDALRAAAKCGDPSIRGSARSALSIVKRRTESPKPKRE